MRRQAGSTFKKVYLTKCRTGIVELMIRTARSRTGGRRAGRT
jgi:hypothetical protein